MSAGKLALPLALVAIAFPAMAAEWNTPESRARWSTLSSAVYGPNVSHLTSGKGLVTIDSPDVAQDAALVPVTLRLAPRSGAREVDLIIDQNPSPIAAKIAFGPAGDPRQIKLRVRVDAFTNMHAVALAADGRLLQTVAFVQGAGGCSAPMGMSVADASTNMGAMKMKFGTDATLGDAPKATLMIRHPNFNGMQMDTAKHALTPARYIQSIAVTQGDVSVFTLTTDISLSTNPVLEFLYRPDADKPLKVTVVDSTKASWTQEFSPPPKGQQAAR